VITAVNFVSINVADQDRAKRFYTEKLGFEEVMDVPMGGPDAPEGPRWIALRPPGAQTEVVLYLDPDKVGGFGPCVFDTDDIQMTAKAFEEAGVEVVKQPTEEFWGWWAEFKDSEGNQFGMGQSRGN
jgi:lactoylglutathione lyase